MRPWRTPGQEADQPDRNSIGAQTSSAGSSCLPDTFAVHDPSRVLQLAECRVLIYLAADGSSVACFGHDAHIHTLQSSLVALLLGSG